jgi:UDP-glucose 4-epimerase
MKVVITGGNGYIGARLSQYLADKGVQTIPVCFPSIPTNEEWKSKMYDVMFGDIRQFETIERIMGFNPDVLIHLVSLDHFESEKDPVFVNEINVLPTWRLLEASTKMGLKKFIYFSTIQVYGKLTDSIIYEDYPVNTVNTYGLTHFLCEQICDHYNRKTQTNVLTVRLSNSYGDPVFSENNCWWLVINDLCKSAYINKHIKLSSDGSPQRDFIHGNDVCQAIQKIIENGSKNIGNNIFHISSGVTLTILEIAIIVKNVYQNRYKQNLPIIALNKMIMNDEVVPKTARYQINNSKIRSIGFAPMYDLQSGINDLFDYLEKNYDKIN